MKKLCSTIVILLIALALLTTAPVAQAQDVPAPTPPVATQPVVFDAGWVLNILSQTPLDSLSALVSNTFIEPGFSVKLSDIGHAIENGKWNDLKIDVAQDTAWRVFSVTLWGFKSQVNIANGTVFDDGKADNYIGIGTTTFKRQLFKPIADASGVLPTKPVTTFAIACNIKCQTTGLAHGNFSSDRTTIFFGPKIQVNY